MILILRVKPLLYGKKEWFNPGKGTGEAKWKQLAKPDLYVAGITYFLPPISNRIFLSRHNIF